MSEEQSEKKQKREYRLGNPLSRQERSKKQYSKLSKDSKLVKFYVPIQVKEDFIVKCKEENVTQSAVMVECMKFFLEDGLCILDRLKNKC